VPEGGRLVPEGDIEGLSGEAEAASAAEPAGPDATSGSGTAERMFTETVVERLLQRTMKLFERKFQGDIAAAVDAKVQLVLASRMDEEGSSTSSRDAVTFYVRTPFVFAGELDDPGTAGKTADQVRRLTMPLATKVVMARGAPSVSSLVGWLSAMSDFGEAHEDRAPYDAAGERYWDAAAHRYMRDMARGKASLSSSEEWYTWVFEYVGANGHEAGSVMEMAPRYTYTGPPNHTADSLRQSLTGWFRVVARLLEGVRDESLKDEMTRGRVVAAVFEKIPSVLSDMVKQRIGYGGRTTVPRWVSWATLASEYMSVLDELLAEVAKGLLYRVPLLAPLGPSDSQGSTAHSGCIECGSTSHHASVCQRRGQGASALAAKGAVGGRGLSGPAGGVAGGAAAGSALVAGRGGAGGGGAAGPAKVGVASAPKVAGAKMGATTGAAGSSTPRGAPGATSTVCYRCGSTGHYADVCTSKESVCYNCKQPGHVKKECPAPKRAAS
jgi:hypothetical protein